MCIRLFAELERAKKEKNRRWEFKSGRMLQWLSLMCFLLIGIFSSLLRLLATHFPHLCLVDDWMERQSHSIGTLYAGGPQEEDFSLTEENIDHGSENVLLNFKIHEHDILPVLKWELNNELLYFC